MRWPRRNTCSVLNARGRMCARRRCLRRPNIYAKFRVYTLCIIYARMRRHTPPVIRIRAASAWWYKGKFPYFKGICREKFSGKCALFLREKYIILSVPMQNNTS